VTHAFSKKKLKKSYILIYDEFRFVESLILTLCPNIDGKFDQFVDKGLT
jgi:hypothetical protein